MVERFTRDKEGVLNKVVHLRADEGIAEVTLRREKINALNESMWKILQEK